MSVATPNFCHGSRPCACVRTAKAKWDADHGPLVKAVTDYEANELASRYADSNYYHRMIQVLPRFELLRLAGVTHAPVDRYLLHAARFPFHGETLAQLQMQQE